MDANPPTASGASSSAGPPNAGQHYSCFISYSTKNEAFARKLHSRLREEGLKVWYSPEDIQAGKKLHEQIGEAIQQRDKLLLVLSKHSMNSEWVKTEIRKARKAEIKEGKRKLFPIRLESFCLSRILGSPTIAPERGRDQQVLEPLGVIPPPVEPLGRAPQLRR